MEQWFHNAVSDAFQSAAWRTALLEIEIRMFEAKTRDVKFTINSRLRWATGRECGSDRNGFDHMHDTMTLSKWVNHTHRDQN